MRNSPLVHRLTVRQHRVVLIRTEATGVATVGRRGIRRAMPALAAAAIAAACACAATAGPAAAAETGTNIVTVLPDTSGLELSVFPRSTALQVDVLRDGVRLASAPITTDLLGAAAVNGGTLGCWSDATPDMLPGDTVHISGAGVDVSTTVEPTTVSRAVDTGAGTVTVHGTAAMLDGAQLPVANLEARIISSSKDAFSNGRRDLRAVVGKAGGSIGYDHESGPAWTAVFTGLTSADVATALAAVDVRGIATSTNPSEQTIAQAPVARGPAPPCTAPLRRDAVTTASRPAVNAATAGADLVISGVAQDASEVTVTLDDADPATAALTVPATLSAPDGAQSFTATIAGGDLRTLADGMLEASGHYTVAGTVVGGATLSVLKDTVAPPAPTATPAPATYGTAQSVALEDADATAAIHWTARAAAPAPCSAAHTAPVLLPPPPTNPAHRPAPRLGPLRRADPRHRLADDPGERRRPRGQPEPARGVPVRHRGARPGRGWRERQRRARGRPVRCCGLRPRDRGAPRAGRGRAAGPVRRGAGAPPPRPPADPAPQRQAPPRAGPAGRRAPAGRRRPRARAGLARGPQRARDRAAARDGLPPRARARHDAARAARRPRAAAPAAGGTLRRRGDAGKRPHRARAPERRAAHRHALTDPGARPSRRAPGPCQSIRRPRGRS